MKIVINGITLIVPSSVTQRLATTCFRGRSVCKAGNFSAWDSVPHLFDDEREITQELAARVTKWNEERDPKTIFVTVNTGHLVGWASTADLEFFTDNELELFDLNRHTRGLRVKPKLAKKGYRAPATQLVTFVLEIKDGAAIIWSIYPGPNIGPLRGRREGREKHNVSKRENVVFYDWEFPGEEDPTLLTFGYEEGEEDDDSDGEEE